MKTEKELAGCFITEQTNIVVNMEAEDLKKLKRPELQKLCKEYTLKATGKNVELIERLEEYFRSVSSKVNDEDEAKNKKDESLTSDQESTALHIQKEPAPEMMERPKKETKPKKQKAAGKNTVKGKRNKKKKQKVKEPDDDDMTEGITDEEHKEYIKTKSASASSQESVFHLTSIGNDSVFIPGKLTEETDKFETNVVSPSLLSSHLTTTESSKLKMATISPLTKGKVTKGSSTVIRHSSLLTENDHNGTYTASPDCNLDQDEYPSSDVSCNRTVSLENSVDCNETICYVDANGTSFDSDRQELGSDADGTFNASTWLGRPSYLARQTTGEYSDCGGDGAESFLLPNGANDMNATFDKDSSAPGKESQCNLTYTEEANATSTDYENDGPDEAYRAIETPEGNDLVDRRQTFVLQNPPFENMRNTVHVQGKARRQTFQITVSQENAAADIRSSFELTYEAKHSTDEQNGDSSFVIEHRPGQLDNTSSRTGSNIGDGEYEVQDGEETVPNPRRTLVLKKSHITEAFKDRRGTYLIRKSDIEEQENSPELRQIESYERKPEREKIERSVVNHCVCHGAVRNSCGWRKLVLKEGAANIQLSQFEFQRLLLKPVEKTLPAGYKDNMVCGQCVAENSSKHSKDNGNKSTKVATKKVLGQTVNQTNFGKRLPNAASKRKCNENHVCESSPATKKQKNSSTGSEACFAGSPASPQVRRARGEKIGLPRHLLEPFKPKRASLERKEDVAYARKVEEIMMTVKPGSKEEMDLIMQKKSKIP